jgi:hypothetical protein
MATIDYIALLEQAFTDYSKLFAERQSIDLELAQKEQFIRATVNMLPDDKRQGWEILLEKLSAEDVGLSDAIRNILKVAPKKLHTATEVKKAMVKAGFDFSRYTTNPLSSVHAALKRLKPEEAEVSQIDGVMAWRWIGPTWKLTLGADLTKQLNSIKVQPNQKVFHTPPLGVTRRRIRRHAPPVDTAASKEALEKIATFFGNRKPK